MELFAIHRSFLVLVATRHDSYVDYQVGSSNIFLAEFIYNLQGSVI